MNIILLEKSYEHINDYRELLRVQGEYDDLQPIDDFLAELLEEIEQSD